MSGAAYPINQLAIAGDTAAPTPAQNALLSLALPPAAQVDPNDYTNQYNTPLSAQEEAAYQAWGQQQAANGRPNPATDTYDYDMRGFWRSGGNFAPNGHGADQFKKPNHSTFSNLSQYQGPSGNIPNNGLRGGTWGGGQNGQPWTFTPSATNLQMNSPAYLQRYFQKVEPGNQLILPGDAQ